MKAVIHDRDKKFALRADDVFRSAGAPVILTPLMAPRANAHIERWIGSCRRECLDWMLIVNQRHLEAIVREYCMPLQPGTPATAAGSCGRRQLEAIRLSPRLARSEDVCGWAV